MSEGDLSLFDKSGDGFPLQSGLILKDAAFLVWRGWCYSGIVEATWCHLTLSALTPRNLQMANKSWCTNGNIGKWLIWMWLDSYETPLPLPPTPPPKKNPVWASRTLMSAIAMEKSVLHPVYRSKPVYWPRTRWLKILLEGPCKATKTYDKRSSDPFPKECTDFCQVNCELEWVEYSNWW